MKRLVAGAMTAILAAAPVSAVGQERAGDAALGAVSGGVIFGPVGAVAGAVVGYTAGPAIARAWGLKKSKPRRARRARSQSAQASPGQEPRAQSASTQGTARQASPQSSRARNKMPAVQTLE